MDYAQILRKSPIKAKKHFSNGEDPGCPFPRIGMYRIKKNLTKMDEITWIGSSNCSSSHTFASVSFESVKSPILPISNASTVLWKGL